MGSAGQRVQCFSVYRDLVSEWIGLKEKLHEAEYHSRIRALHHVTTMHALFTTEVECKMPFVRADLFLHSPENSSPTIRPDATRSS